MYILYGLENGLYMVIKQKLSLCTSEPGIVKEVILSLNAIVHSVIMFHPRKTILEPCLKIGMLKKQTYWTRLLEKALGSVTVK